MTNKALLDLYTDYLICSIGQTTGTGLSALLGGSVSHDRIQRFLGGQEFTSADLWHFVCVKPHVRAVEHRDGCIIVDDSIPEKPYTDENDIIAWHYYHSKGTTIKGINFLSALYHVSGLELSLPTGFRLVRKTELYVDKKDGKTKRRDPISKNEHYQALLYRFVLNDVWYACEPANPDNMRFIKVELERDFIMPLKTNRKVALSEADKRQGRYIRVDSVPLATGEVVTVYLEGIDFPLISVKQLFVNEDGSQVTQYLVCSDVIYTFDQITTIYNSSLRSSVERGRVSQVPQAERFFGTFAHSHSRHPDPSSHNLPLFASLCGYVKLELLKVSNDLNHFALKSSIYLRAMQVAFDAPRQFQPIRLAA